MIAKHSVGQWIKVRDADHPGNIRISSSSRRHIAKVYAEGAQYDEVAEANANLITLAPNMRFILAILASYDPAFDDDHLIIKEIQRRALAILEIV
jgi:hypothetical protein